ncbi:MAG: Unknown protein [uncultured Thiotrichaceae bacterium]|uniref:Uncharacterized protein n=1 Tax=uncultured Thiotrichaceae bacterium TaxID=298394 RepID=A0A6S6TXS3_9GAMM|nr:MAG: Unknown protein [uncultured Thiotrichaceae bacterium]
MRIRIKTKWSKQERDVSVEDAVSVLAFNAWKIGMQTLLEIENENFQVDTQQQRVAIIEEVMSYLIHIIDRMVFDTIDDEGRASIITEYAKKIADHVQDNARDFSGPGDYRTPFIEKLNLRMDDYADCMWDDERNLPGFNMGRVFGNHVTNALGERDQKWALDYVSQVLLPDVMQTYKRAVLQVGLIEDKPEA